jgi:hypothetical protein
LTNSCKITIIILYGHSWPGWFNYFLLSCETNKTINWLIFSENKGPAIIPENVRFIYISAEDLSLRIKEKLDINPVINHPFKFSDFKPAYGLIFEDYIKDSAVWGYCDLDLVFGNFSKFITTEIIKDYDIISPSIDFFPGHFLLLKNHDNLTQLFKLVPDWKEILSQPGCFCFDEKISHPSIQPDSFSIQKALKRNIRKHLREYHLIRNPFFHFMNHSFGRIIKKGKNSLKEIKDFNSAINSLRNQGNIRTYNQQWFMDDIIKLRDGKKSYRIDWNQGRLLDGQNEILYFHFPLSKYSDSFRIDETDKSHFTLINEDIGL